MRILLHDYGGYRFILQLAQTLAQRGHRVSLVSNSSVLGPARSLDQSQSQHPGLEITGLSLDREIQKESLFTRWKQERAFGRALVRHAEDWMPDVVISANAPLEPQAQLQAWSRRRQVPFVFWLQDLIGLAVRKLAGKKLPVIGPLAGLYYIHLEQKLLRQSDVVVLITEDFKPQLRRWGLETDDMVVIPNWAPLEELSPGPKENPWSQAHALADKFTFLYSGSLGLKHNPQLLLDLAEGFKAEPDVRVVVISQGPAADWLAREKSRLQLQNLVLLPFQPAEDMPRQLAAADTLLALLEPEASIFSVPSKILSYFCAGRPVLVAVPLENMAARIVKESGAGCAVDPGVGHELLANARKLYADAQARRLCGERARAYAETHFAIEPIADRFEQVLSRLAPKLAS